MGRVYKIRRNKNTITYIESMGNNKYIAYGVTHGSRKPKIVGLTVPSTLKQLEFHFGIKIPGR